MKTSTILLLAAGGAAVLFFALRGGSAASGATATGRAAPAQDAGSSRDQLERTAINLGGKVVGGLIDSWFSDERGAISV